MASWSASRAARRATVAMKATKQSRVTPSTDAIAGSGSAESNSAGWRSRLVLKSDICTSSHTAGRNTPVQCVRCGAAAGLPGGLLLSALRCDGRCARGCGLWVEVGAGLCGLEVVIQLVDQRDSCGDVELCDRVVRDAVEVLDQ